eukprot:scaffold226865_cov31-Tisochrysis_lutea.AAC.4
MMCCCHPLARAHNGGKAIQHALFLIHFVRLLVIPRPREGSLLILTHPSIKSWPCEWPGGDGVGEHLEVWLSCARAGAGEV